MTLRQHMCILRAHGEVQRLGFSSSSFAGKVRSCITCPSAAHKLPTDCVHSLSYYLIQISPPPPKKKPRPLARRVIAEVVKNLRANPPPQLPAPEILEVQILRFVREHGRKASVIEKKYRAAIAWKVENLSTPIMQVDGHSATHMAFSAWAPVRLPTI